MRRLALAWLVLVLLAAPVGADEKARGVVPLTRSPHMFEEPQAKYPPLGAVDAFREALPLAVGAALASFALAMWLTRPLPEMEMALHQRETRVPGPVAPQTVQPAPPAAVALEAPPPALVAPVVPSTSGPAAVSAPAETEVSRPVQVAREQVREVQAPTIPEAAPENRVPVSAPRIAGPRVSPPEESPLQPFSWQEAAPDRPLPLRDGEATPPGLVIYRVEPSSVPTVVALLAADLLLDSPGRVILASVSAGPAEVVEVLLEAGPQTPRAELLARLRREGRAIDRLARRLFVPRGGGLTAEGLLRRGRELAEVKGGCAGVVLEPATRLEMGSLDLASWLRALHEVGTHGGFPLFLVAPRPGFPVGSSPGRVVDLDEVEIARLSARNPGAQSGG